MVHMRREVITLNRNVPIVIKGVLHSISLEIYKK